MASPRPFPAVLFYEDLALRELYMKALSRTLKASEIRDGFDNVGVKPLHIRMEMLRDAADIFAVVPEYEAYLAARQRVRVRLDVFIDDLRATLREDQLRGPLAGVGYTVTVAGLVAATLSMIIDWGVPWIVGVPMVLVGGLALFASWASTRPMAFAFLDRLHGLIQPLANGPWRARTARVMLIAALEKDELAAQIRQRINALRWNRFDHDFRVAASPGLSEAFDSAYHVPTMVARELDGLLGRLSGASIGIAGPRGSGKSTLIRRYCEEHAEVADQGDLRCQVSAPVEYAPRDFVLHLFATFCRHSLRYFATVGRPRFGPRLARTVLAYWLVAWAIVEWPEQVLSILTNLSSLLAPLLEPLFEVAAREIPEGLADELLGSAEAVARLLSILVIGAGIIHVLVRAHRHGRARRSGPPARLVAQARGHLVQIRYLQTFTSGWSGTVKLPAWVEGQASRGHSRAEQPLSYPEIVSAFRAHAQDVAAHLQPRHSVYIGIDELDKLGSGADAERFLNEIKGIFGLPTPIS
ncbi:hypothetical protein GCM10022226_11090 [Sphaerisporangium flaviroseum]|uniref:KAP NTPase domain-containing protein n=1 Tax=Sphaerisporangium flaviroseum TaxID=509199 RepID=A0ABP7HP26_9ACTN